MALSVCVHQALAQQPQSLSIQPSRGVSPVNYWESPPSRSPIYSSRRQPQEGSVVELQPAAESAADPQTPSVQLGTPTVWNLEHVEALALAGHPALLEASARVQAAQGSALQAGLRPNPQLGYAGEELGSGESDKHGIMLQQQFVRGGKLALDQAVQCAEVDWRSADLARQRQQVLTDVRIAFYEVLVSDRRVQLNRTLIDILSQALSAAESLVRVKEGSKVDVLQAQIELETAAAVLVQAELEFQAAWRRLATLLGQPDLAPQQLVADVESTPAALTFDEAWVQLETQSPELMQAQIAVDKACRAHQRAQVETIPDVHLQATLQYDQAMPGVNGNLQVLLPIPILNQNQGRIHETMAEWTAAQEAFGRKRLELYSNLADVFARYATALNQVQNYRDKILPKAAENLELARRGYEAGEFNFIQVLTVQRTYADKNSIYLDALGSMWSLRLEIEGLLLKGSLAAAR